MDRLNLFDLNEFIKLVSQGELGPGLPIEVKNMGGNQIHRMSFSDHCGELCNKHNTNDLRLLSVIQQKLNGDMIVRLGHSPVFRDKVKIILNEWGENNVEPIDLFQCADSCYDHDHLSSLID